ncbi:hypothetical protein AAFF_G00423770 [Aldrovandia affinis]|uniref:Uncharacterized protein n=1 Tax=Aldrovandia affinis TaxID=143900 RepID=A0AAD7T6X8_9TELE|nr:hypothetical protein AAFF_G00423770 [Aldrovandia affinis]
MKLIKEKEKVYFSVHSVPTKAEVPQRMEDTKLELENTYSGKQHQDIAIHGLCSAVDSGRKWAPLHLQRCGITQLPGPMLHASVRGRCPFPDCRANYC